MRKNIAMDQLMCEAYRKENAEEFYGLSKDGVDDLIEMVEDYIIQYEAAQARIAELENMYRCECERVEKLEDHIERIERKGYV